MSGLIQLNHECTRIDTDENTEIVSFACEAPNRGPDVAVGAFGSFLRAWCEFVSIGGFNLHGSGFRGVRAAAIAPAQPIVARV